MRGQRLIAPGSPPIAEQRAHRTTYHGRTLEDPYHWLRDPGYPDVSDPDVLAYLEAENAYHAAVMEPHQQLSDLLFREIKGRQQEEDESPSWRDGGWLYRWCFKADAEYRSWQRRPLLGDGPWQCFLDETELATGLDYFHLGGWDISPDGRLLAYACDRSGGERYSIEIQDLETGEQTDTGIADTMGVPVWAMDSRTLLYTPVDANWRPWRLCAHQPGTSPAQDEVLYEEKDASFLVSVSLTRSKAHMVLTSADHVTSELWLLSAGHPSPDLVPVAGRNPGHKYELDHGNSRFYIRTNDQHQNFRVVSAPENEPAPRNWREEIAPSKECYIRAIAAFQDCFVLEERFAGLDQIRVCDYQGNDHRIAFPEATREVGLDVNEEFATDHLRLHYSSLVTPPTIYDYWLSERRLEVRKVQAVLGGYCPLDYVSEHLTARARDGALVPLSIVYRKDFRKDGHQPLHLYAYGAYGYSVPPAFSVARLALLNRGIAFAIAHVRGGDELGYHWYETGKLLQRKNSFHDFIDAAHYLISEGYSGAGRISISGASAGGELIGVVLNEAPSLWCCATLDVPFVDVLNTMLDETLPLTPLEWPEWGNPITDVTAFDYIRAYSPYDCIRAQDYPPILITAGLHDPRVIYWEPAKWVARMRVVKTDTNPLLFKVNMESGHAGRSGRFEHIKEIAEQYTFLLLATGSPAAQLPLPKEGSASSD